MVVVSIRTDWFCRWLEYSRTIWICQHFFSNFFNFFGNFFCRAFHAHFDDLSAAMQVRQNWVRVLVNMQGRRATPATVICAYSRGMVYNGFDVPGEPNRASHSPSPPPNFCLASPSPSHLLAPPPFHSSFLHPSPSALTPSARSTCGGAFTLQRRYIIGRHCPRSGEAAGQTGNARLLALTY